MKIVMKNFHKVASHNKLYARGIVSNKLEINKYADRLYHEFIKIVNGFNTTKKDLKQKILLHLFHQWMSNCLMR